MRYANERGRSRLNWLDSYHTFSFANYHDAEHMGFSVLRVINEDVIAPGSGFAAHAHRDMEIVTYVLEGALKHKDTIGNGTVIRSCEVQCMSAGTGVTHSEYDASETTPVHLLQIWIAPSQNGIAPSYEQKRFRHEEFDGRLRMVVSPDGRTGSLRIYRDAGN